MTQEQYNHKDERHKPEKHFLQPDLSAKRFQPVKQHLKSFRKHQKTQHTRALSDDYIGNNLLLRYEVLEERPVNTFIGNVKLDLQREKLRFHRSIKTENDLNNILSSNNNISKKLQKRKRPRESSFELTFMFISDSVPMFQIGMRSGIISTKTVIDRDREGFCRRKAECRIQTSLAVQLRSELLEIVKVVVDIIDSNDNPPRLIALHEFLKSRTFKRYFINIALNTLVFSVTFRSAL